MIEFGHREAGNSRRVRVRMTSHHMTGGVQRHHILGADKPLLANLRRGDEEVSDHAPPGQCRRHGDGTRTAIIEGEQAVARCRSRRCPGDRRKARTTCSQHPQMRVELGHVELVVARRAAGKATGVGLPRLDHVVVHQRRNLHRAVALATARRQPR